MTIQPRTELGLTTFPVPTDFFESHGVPDVVDKYGAGAGLVPLYLLIWIYLNGYYVEWDCAEWCNFCGFMDEHVHKDLRIYPVNAIITTLSHNGFFDRALYRDRGILTSSWIQDGWIEYRKIYGNKSTDIKPELRLTK